MHKRTPSDSETRIRAIIFRVGHKYSLTAAAQKVSAEGAATSRPSVRALAPLLSVCSWAIDDVASDDMSNTTAGTRIPDSLILDIFPMCWLSAASANATYLSVDFYFLLIKGLWRYDWWNVRGAGLAVAYRRRPGSGRCFSCG